MNNKEEKWLVAVSAGPDSMALLNMCIEKGIAAAAAHVNYHHQIHADEEEEYLRSFCSKNGIPLFVRNEEFHPQGNFEAEARTWRYDFFADVVRKNKYKGVLIAHQEDDVIETYLMQKERNIVPSWYGLRRESAYHGVRIMRPLLSSTKEQLRLYCDEHHVRYYMDETNADLNITRNRIRHEAVDHMSRMERDAVLKEIDMANGEKGCVEHQAGLLFDHQRIFLAAYRRSGARVRLSALRRLIDEKNAFHLTLGFIKETDNVIMHHRDFMIPYRDQYVVTDQKYIFLYQPVKEYEDTYSNEAEVTCGIHSGYRIEPGRPSVYAVTVKDEDFPVTIRSFRDGDEIHMRYGTKKAARFFIDRQIPLYLRKSWPVVLNAENQVILVPGLGCDCAHYSEKPTFNVIQYTQIEELHTDVGRKRH